MIVLAGTQTDQSSSCSKSSSRRTLKQESFDSENDFTNKDETLQQPYNSIDLKRVNKKKCQKSESRGNGGEVLELDEAFNQPSDSESSMDSKKVETDSLCLEDDDYPSSIIQDFKFDYSGNRPDYNFSDLTSPCQKDDFIALSPGIMNNLSRIRTSTKKEDNTSLEVICSTETSLAGSSQDLSDDTTISDTESLSKLRTSLKSKVLNIFSSLSLPSFIELNTCKQENAMHSFPFKSFSRAFKKVGLSA